MRMADVNSNLLTPRHRDAFDQLTDRKIPGMTGTIDAQPMPIQHDVLHSGDLGYIGIMWGAAYHRGEAVQMARRQHHRHP